MIPSLRLDIVTPARKEVHIIGAGHGLVKLTGFDPDTQYDRDDLLALAAALKGAAEMVV